MSLLSGSEEQQAKPQVPPFSVVFGGRRLNEQQRSNRSPNGKCFPAPACSQGTRVAARISRQRCKCSGPHNLVTSAQMHALWDANGSLSHQIPEVDSSARRRSTVAGMAPRWLGEGQALPSIAAMKSLCLALSLSVELWAMDFLRVYC